MSDNTVTDINQSFDFLKQTFLQIHYNHAPPLLHKQPFSQQFQHQSLQSLLDNKSLVDNQQQNYQNQSLYQPPQQQQGINTPQLDLRQEFESFKQSNFCNKECYQDFMCHTLFNNYGNLVKNLIDQHDNEDKHQSVNSLNREQNHQNQSELTIQNSSKIRQEKQQTTQIDKEDVNDEEFLKQIQSNKHLKRLCKSIFEAGYHYKKYEENQ